MTSNQNADGFDAQTRLANRSERELYAEIDRLAAARERDVAEQRREIKRLTAELDTMRAERNAWMSHHLYYHPDCRESFWPPRPAVETSDCSASNYNGDPCRLPAGHSGPHSLTRPSETTGEQEASIQSEYYRDLE